MIAKHWGALFLCLQVINGFRLVAEDGPSRPENSQRIQLAFEDDPHQIVKNSGLTEGAFISSFDGTEQPFRYWAPASNVRESRPILVFLHSWLADYRQYKADWIQAAVQRDWIFLQPNFRGPNDNPSAGGSPQAQQDVLDSIDWAVANLKVDRSRIYLAGASGGGHMTMLLAGRHPERFTAASAWVGISDLKDWHRFQSRGGKEGRYAASISALCGGPPGRSEQVDEQYLNRSPIHWIQNLGELPMDLAAGVHDGQRGSVPIDQTLNVFNAIAKARGASMVTPEEISQLQKNGHLQQPSQEDVIVDDSYGRDIKLRRHAGSARVTIFEGAHEGIANAACEWLSHHERPIDNADGKVSLKKLE